MCWHKWKNVKAEHAIELHTLYGDRIIVQSIERENAFMCYQSIVKRKPISIVHQVCTKCNDIRTKQVEGTVNV